MKLRKVKPSRKAPTTSDRNYIVDPPLLDVGNTELVFGFVYAVGTDFDAVITKFTKILRKFRYEANVVRLSKFLENFDEPLRASPEAARIRSMMNAGNKLCRKAGRNDLFALAAVNEILFSRRAWDDEPEPKGRVAHVLLSLKRPDEVHLLRKVYREGFFLVGVYSSEENRLQFLLNKNSPKREAENLIERDRSEDDPFGQQTRKTFALSDVFIDFDSGSFGKDLERFLELVFSNPYTTPTPDEHAMFLAYSASLRSAQLGRQVGASIRKGDDVIAVGCNDVPRPGGGLYWPGSNDKRDHKLGYDSNDEALKNMGAKVLEKLKPYLQETPKISPKKLFKDVLDITEFGRATHAEMEALLSCVRSGACAKGAVLYTTTFPCHNCSRHILTAGISEVIYIEPYPKSKAADLHFDSIVVDRKPPKNDPRIPFRPFVGVGPRRFFDLFSMSLSSGYRLVRKNENGLTNWTSANAIPRIPMQVVSYLRREQTAGWQLNEVFKGLKA